jgi:hypothetical protein
MEQRQIGIALLLLAVLPVFAQEKREVREFYEVGGLSPDINRLEEFPAKTGRTLVFLDTYRKKVIVTDTDFEEETVLDRFCGFAVSEITKGYWDYYTGKNYMMAKYGWYFPEKTGNGFRAVAQPVREFSRLTFEDGPGDNSNWIQLGNGDAVRKGSRTPQLTVYNPRTNEVYYQNTISYGNVLWPGGNWIIPVWSDLSFGDDETPMVNYKTGEERTFYPEVILGVGKNLVMTTGKNWIGFTIWNLDNEIVYRDAEFNLRRQIHEKWMELFNEPSYAEAKRSFVLGVIDLPYVYLPMRTYGGPLLRGGYAVLDLREGKAYYSSHMVTYLLGVFE